MTYGLYQFENKENSYHPGEQNRDYTGFTENNSTFVQPQNDALLPPKSEIYAPSKGNQLQLIHNQKITSPINLVSYHNRWDLTAQDFLNLFHLPRTREQRAICMAFGFVSVLMSIGVTVITRNNLKPNSGQDLQTSMQVAALLFVSAEIARCLMNKNNPQMKKSLAIKATFAATVAASLLLPNPAQNSMPARISRALQYNKIQSSEAYAEYYLQLNRCNGFYSSTQSTALSSVNQSLAMLVKYQGNQDPKVRYIYARDLTTKVDAYNAVMQTGNYLRAGPEFYLDPEKMQNIAYAIMATKQNPDLNKPNLQRLAKLLMQVPKLSVERTKFGYRYPEPATP